MKPSRAWVYCTETITAISAHRPWNASIVMDSAIVGMAKFSLYHHTIDEVDVAA